MEGYNFVIISGSRTIDDAKFVNQQLDEMLQDIENPAFIVGDAKGVDKIAFRYSIEHDIPAMVFKAEWGRFGNMAGMIRNGEMFNFTGTKTVGRYMIAFWKDGSHGTMDMVFRARNANWTKMEDKDFDGGISVMKFKEEK